MAGDNVTCRLCDALYETMGEAFERLLFLTIAGVAVIIIATRSTIAGEGISGKGSGLLGNVNEVPFVAATIVPE
jgi:hypothetical protein